MGCAVAYSAYSYYDHQSQLDDLEKNAKIKPVADGFKTGMDMPRKKGKFVKRSDGKSIFVEDPNQPSTAATSAVGASAASASPAGTQPTIHPSVQPTVQPITAPPVVAAAAPAVVASPAAPVVATSAPPPPPPSGASALPATNPQPAAIENARPTLPAVAEQKLNLPPPPPVTAINPTAAPLIPQVEKVESTCHWKSSTSHLNVRYGQTVFRVNLRAGLDAKSPMLKQFLGHSKPTVVGSDEKAKCETENCLIIDSNFLSSLAGSSSHDYKCGDWYLVTDGPAEGCEAQTKSRSLRVTNSKDNLCVVGSLTDASSSGPAPKSKVLASSLFVTTTKAESEKPAASKEKPNDE